MPREKPLFRANLDRLDQEYPNKELLSCSEVAKYLGRSTKTVTRIFGQKGKRVSSISKVKVADYLS